MTVDSGDGQGGEAAAVPKMDSLSVPIIVEGGEESGEDSENERNE